MSLTHRLPGLLLFFVSAAALSQPGLKTVSRPLTFSANINGNPALIEIFLKEGADPAAAIQLYGSATVSSTPPALEEFFTSGLEWSQFLDHRRHDSVAQLYNPGGDPSGGAGLAALRAAEQKWSHVKDSNFRFAFGGTTTLCPNMFGFALPASCPPRGYFDGNNVLGWLTLPDYILGITQTIYHRYTGEILQADIAINISSQGYDIESIILHEEGHFAGLAHNGFDPNSVMYPSLALGQRKRVLTDDETDGLAYLYPNKHLAKALDVNFTFTDIIFPGATRTHTLGINNHGAVVGYYSFDIAHAFLVKEGQFIALDPSSVLGTNYSVATKVNDRGDVVGYFCDAAFCHGFALRHDGVLTQLDVPGAGDTYAFGINNSGMVVGQFDVLDSQGNVIATHGFIWDGSTFGQVDYPFAGDTYLFGINDRGDLVGGWDYSPYDPSEYGFRRKNGQYMRFDYSEPTVPTRIFYTVLTDINAKGQMVGIYGDTAGDHGFRIEGETINTINYPGATHTYAWGINNDGQIVGYGIDSIRQSHSFMAVSK